MKQQFGKKTQVNEEEEEKKQANKRKGIIERENEEGEERLLDELDQIEARILQNLDDSRTDEGDTQKWNRLLTYFNIYVNSGSCTDTEECKARPLESWQYTELVEALQNGSIYVGKNGGLVRNF